MVQSIISLIAISLIICLILKLKSPSSKGRRSEAAVARRLNTDSMQKNGGKVLTNIYVPKPSGDTAEIDLLYITRKGLLVLENKNYAGYIFGNESNKNWMATLYGGYGKVEKYPFYNPVWQNHTHIKCLKEYMGCDIKFFSLITFSNRGSLKSITVNSPDVFVCNHAKLSKVLQKIWDDNPDILSDTQIEKIYQRLLPLTNTSEEAQQKHIADIQNRFNHADVCPSCGGRLVLRTAMKGPYAGNQFWGCSNYPKCKYIKNHKI